MAIALMLSLKSRGSHTQTILPAVHHALCDWKIFCTIKFWYENQAHFRCIFRQHPPVPGEELFTEVIWSLKEKKAVKTSYTATTLRKGNIVCYLFRLISIQIVTWALPALRAKVTAQDGITTAAAGARGKETRTHHQLGKTLLTWLSFCS